MKNVLLCCALWCCANPLSAQTDTLDWLLQLFQVREYDWRRMAGQTPRANILPLLPQLSGTLLNTEAEDDSTLLAELFWNDVDRDGREDLVNVGHNYGYHEWTQVFLTRGKDVPWDGKRRIPGLLYSGNKGGKNSPFLAGRLQFPGGIRYFQQSEQETVVAAYGEACCGYGEASLSVMAVQHDARGPRFRYLAMVHCLWTFKDSLSAMTEKRPFVTTDSVAVQGAPEADYYDIARYAPGVAGYALREYRDSSQVLWYQVIIPPTPRLVVESVGFTHLNFYWRNCYYAAGWLPARLLTFD